jgi:hypothetical protein
MFEQMLLENFGWLLAAALTIEIFGASTVSALGRFVFSFFR